MTARENKERVRNYLDAVWGERDIDAMDEYLSPAYRRYPGPNAEPITLEGQKARITGFQVSLPDADLTIEDVFGEEDRVAFRSTLRATHHGELLGISPTGNRIEVALLDVMRLEDGRIIEHWGGPDMLDLLQQLGAIISVE